MKRIPLAARRKTVGLSQESLAEQLGVDVSTVRRWEHGDRQPQPWQRHNLATALDVTLEVLDELLSDGTSDLGDSPYAAASGALASSRIGNAGLEALIRGAGFASLKDFAKAVNKRVHNRRKLCTRYDPPTVKRWLAGAHISNPDVVAEVLGDAWGVPIPVEVIWPGLRDGKPPTPAHLQPWVAGRTMCAASRSVVSPVQPGGTRREVLGSDGLPVAER